MTIPSPLEATGPAACSVLAGSAAGSRAPVLWHRVASCLSRELTAPGHAREQARKALFGWGLGEYCEDAEVIISELVTNAVRHGAGPPTIGIAYDGRQLRIDVHDDGSGRPVRHRVTLDSESWRGLAVIDGLIEPYGGTLDVTDDSAGGGKTVSVSLCLNGSQ